MASAWKKILQPALVAGCFVLAGCATDAPRPGTDAGSRAMPVAEPVFREDGIAVGATGKEIGFGRAEPGAVAAMTKLIGRAPAGTGPACTGLRTTRWPDGTTLFFEPRAYDPAAFVGWQRGSESAGRTCTS
jgi:hypothetical protein